MFAIIINKQGYKVEFVALGDNKKPMFYTLKDSETIIEKDWQIANGMNKPQWNGTEWIDTEPLPPIEPEPPQPNEMEILRNDVQDLKQQNAQLLLEIALLKTP